MEEEKDGLAEAAERAEEATRRAQEAKERAYRRDCGDSPSYCMYERAGHLAGLTGGANPMHHSVDTWSFTVARDRSLAYYQARLLGERPASDAGEEKARSALRKDFYAYAIAQLRACELHETPTSLEGSLPRFPRNLDELRGTSLYTTAKYPVDTEGELPVMHAWEGCAGLGGRAVRRVRGVQVHGGFFGQRSIGVHGDRQRLRVPLRRRCPSRR